MRDPKAKTNLPRTCINLNLGYNFPTMTNNHHTNNFKIIVKHNTRYSSHSTGSRQLKKQKQKANNVNKNL